MTAIDWIMKQWRSWHRWRRADHLGWATWAPLWRMGGEKADSFEARWRIRNSNRLYRLTRGHGNPWKKFKGF